MLLVKRSLWISDTQCPYMHQDGYMFLRAVKKKYGPFDLVGHIGDEIDNTALSDFDPNPDGLTHGQELEASVEQLEPIYELFPKVIVFNSNHVEGRIERRRKRAGFSRLFLRQVKDVIGAPAGWQWKDDLTIKLPTGQRCYITHGLDKNGLNLTKSFGMCTIQGHHHTKFAIQYHSTPHYLNWAMQIGCLIDSKAEAFAYAKKNKDRDILGLGLVINGLPLLVPMLLNHSGRWTGYVS